MSEPGQLQGQQSAVPIFPTLGPFQLARWMRWQCAALFVIGVGFWGAFAFHQTDIVAYGYRMDFLGIYVGPRAVASGYGPQLYDLQVQKAMSAAAIRPYQRSVMPFVYPEYVAVVLRPLGSLSFSAAIKTWLLINFAAVFWTATRLSRLFAVSIVDRAAILVVFLAWTPLQLTLVQGQLGMFPTVALTEALIALSSGSQWRAGIWLSLGLLKPQLIVFPVLLLVIWRCWRALAAFTAVACAVVGASLAAIGNWIPKYLHFLAEYNRRGAELSLYPIAMQNWRGLASWLFKTDQGIAPRVVIVLLTAISVVVLWLIAGPGRTARFELSELALQRARFGAAIVLGLLSSPHLYMHDWVAALPAGFTLWSFARERYSQDAHDFYAASLLWLIGLAPVLFFVKQFLWSAPILPIYGIVLVVAVTFLLRPDIFKQRKSAFLPARGNGL